MILPWDDATFDMYFSDDRKVVTCMMQWWMNYCVFGCNRGFVIKCIDFFSDWLHSLLGSIRLNVRSSQYETSLLTLAIEPHSAYPAGSVLSALAQMRVKRMGRGPCCSPCQRLGLAQRDGNWDTLRWPICTNPRASANNPLSWLHPSSAFSKVSPQTRLLKPFVTQRSVHWETRANTKSQCLLSWGECNSRIPRVGISDRQSNSTQYLLSVGLLGLPSQHTCMSCREVYMEVH